MSNQEVEQEESSSNRLSLSIFSEAYSHHLELLFSHMQLLGFGLLTMHVATTAIVRVYNTKHFLNLMTFLVRMISCMSYNFEADRQTSR